MKATILGALIGGAILGVPVFGVIWAFGGLHPPELNTFVAFFYGCPAAFVGMIVGAIVGGVIHRKWQRKDHDGSPRESIDHESD